MERKRILILGGGFGGVYTARALERLLTPDEAEITVVSCENYFVFQPLLPEVISGSIGLLDVVCPLRRLCRRTQVYVRNVDGIDLERRIVTLAPAFRPRALELPYDRLVIALGTLTDFTGMTGLAEHAFPFRTLGDALRLRNHVLQVLEEADNETDPEFRSRLLTFVVAGGGFSGVEVIAELNDFLRRATRHYRRVPPAEIRCVLVHSGDRILPELAPSLAEYAQKLISRRGVSLKLRSRVMAATADSVHLEGGEILPARTLISTVPAGPVPLLQALACRKERGRIVVNEFLEVEGQEDRVWALGDCASIRLPDRSVTPPTAQHATREAQTAAANIAASLRRSRRQPFRFSGLGKLGSLGHHSAVAEVFGMKFSGMPAWLLWRSVYLMKMPGLDRRIRVGFDWLTALLFPGELVQLRIQTSPNLVNEHYEAGEILFEQGDMGTCFYVIREGEVEVVIDGRRVALLGPGQYVGEMALLSNSPRNATVRATRSTDVLAVARNDFGRLLENLPELRAAVVAVARQRQDR